MNGQTCIVCGESALPRLRWCAECVPESVKQKAKWNADHRARKAAGLVQAPAPMARVPAVPTPVRPHQAECLPVLPVAKPSPAVVARKPEKQAQATAARLGPGPVVHAPDFRAIVVQVQALCAEALACPLPGVVSTVAPIPVPVAKEPPPVPVPSAVLPELVRKALAMPSPREEPDPVQRPVQASPRPAGPAAGAGLTPSLAFALPLTDVQVRAARAAAPTVQGAPLPQCPCCLRLRMGQDGTPGEGRLLCLKDELEMIRAFGDEGPDAAGRSAILEDRRGDASVYWLRADIANLSSARVCRYYLPHPCLAGEADGSVLGDRRDAVNRWGNEEEGDA